MRSKVYAEQILKNMVLDLKSLLALFSKWIVNNFFLSLRNLHLLMFSALNSSVPDTLKNN